MSGRIEFSDSTKELIAKRAGFVCSFPDCGSPTVGPGQGLDEIQLVGEAAHIFSAAEGGPRGQGGRREEELRAPQNGIWLCRSHAKIVDAHRGRDYPASALLSYKALHESKVARALGVLSCPFGWLEELTITASPYILPPATIHFAKSTVFSGGSGTGKSTLFTYLAITASFDLGEEWLQSRPAERRHHEFSLTYRQPDRHRINVCINDRRIHYQLDGHDVPFNPLPFTVVELRPELMPKEERLRIGGMTPDAIERALLRFEIPIKGESRRILRAADGSMELSSSDGDFIPVRNLSGGEHKMFLIECAMALAQFCSNYRPTVLLLDDGLHRLDSRCRAIYLQRIAAADRTYQTILIDQAGARDVMWGGWQSVEFRENRDGSIISEGNEIFNR
jgi:hypothetical protein